MNQLPTMNGTPSPQRSPISRIIQIPFGPVDELIKTHGEAKTSLKLCGIIAPNIEKKFQQMLRAVIFRTMISIATATGGLVGATSLHQYNEEQKERGEITAQQEDIEIQSRYLINWVQWLRENSSALLTKESELKTERILESMENLGNREFLLSDREVRKKILEEQRIILNWLKNVSVALNAPSETLEVSEAMQNIEIDGKLWEAMNNFTASAREFEEAVQSVMGDKAFFDGDKKIIEIIEEILRGIQSTAELLRATKEAVESGNFDSIKIEEFQEKKYLIYLQLCDSRGILESLSQQMMERAKILKKRHTMYEEKSFEERENLIENMLQFMEQKLQKMLDGSDLPLKELAEEFMKIFKEFKEIQQEGYDISDQKKFFIAIWELNETIDESIVIREKTAQSLHDIMSSMPNQP